MSTPFAPVDMRGKLPTNREATYTNRPTAEIVGVTYHYTAGPPNGTAESTAAYQTSEGARAQTGNGTPFPGLAYTMFVEQDGRVILAWDLATRVWHSAATVNGIARNRDHIGICYAGNVEPNAAQKLGMANALNWCQAQLGRKLTVEGHGWVYSTACPGATSRTWIPQVLALAAGSPVTPPPAPEQAPTPGRQTPDGWPWLTWRETAINYRAMSQVGTH